MKVMRALWAPIGWMLRIMAWFLFAPIGLWLSWRKGRNRRHRQMVDAMAHRSQRS